jgi:hypothetical protein
LQLAIPYGPRRNALTGGQSSLHLNLSKSHMPKSFRDLGHLTL